MSRKKVRRSDRQKTESRPETRRAYEPPRIVYCEKLESLAAVCDSARAPSGACRVSTVATCVTLFS